MIQQILLDSDWREDKLSKEIFVPCLQAFSIRNGLRLRDVRFCGGTSELGNDIEYYEVLGPDFFRSYTGIQVKKGTVSQSDAGELIRQGEEAFEKDIADIGSGQTYRLGRWVVAATGSVTDPAQREILKRLQRYGKPIHFWDGLKLGALIMEYFYREFVERMGVSAFVAASNNLQTCLWDPDKPIPIAENFASADFQELDISKAAHEVAAGLLLTVRPRDKNLPSVCCIIRSSIDEITIDSVQSQLHPYLLRLAQPDKVEAILLDPTRPVDILARGYVDIL